MNLLSNSAKLLWFSVAFCAGWLTPYKFRSIALILLGAIFLGCCSPVSLFLIIILSVGSYYLSRIVENKIFSFMVILIATCLIFLWYKGMAIDQSLIPIGLSYYALRTLHYSIECSEPNFPQHSFKEYLCYQFFLPTLFVGPIHRFPEFLDDLAKRRWNIDLFSQGLERILLGAVKIKIFSAFLIGVLWTNWIETFQTSSPALYQYFDCIRYGSTLYFSFSGYSDIAIGFSLILGFRLLENFHFPFLASNLKEFWNRWHISLTQWSKDYIARPLLAYSRNYILTSIASLLIIGFWHEPSWRYILWGLYHGLGIALYNLWLRWKKKNIKLDQVFSLKPMKIFSNILTLHFVIFSFPLTKEPDLPSAIKSYQILLSKCFMNI